MDIMGSSYEIVRNKHNGDYISASSKSIDNTKSIRNPVNNNTIITMGRATSKETAMKLGRGATAALQYYDEFDFINFQTEIMNAASFAYSTAATNAAKNGSLYSRVLSSTPIRH